MVCDICYDDSLLIDYSGNGEPKYVEQETTATSLFLGSNGSSILNEHIRVYFIVTRLFKMPGTEFLKLLESRRKKKLSKFGNEEKETLLYGTTCARCNAVVDEAVALHQNVLKLQKSIGRLGRRLLELKEIGHQRKKKQEGQTKGIGSIVSATKINIKSVKKPLPKKDSQRSSRKSTSNSGANMQSLAEYLILSNSTNWNKREPLEAVSVPMEEEDTMAVANVFNDVEVKEEAADSEETFLTPQHFGSQVQDGTKSIDEKALTAENGKEKVTIVTNEDDDSDVDYVPTESTDEDIDHYDDDEDYIPEGNKTVAKPAKKKGTVSGRDKTKFSTSGEDENDLEEAGLSQGDDRTTLNLNSTVPSFMHQCPKCLKVCSSHGALDVHTRSAHDFETFYTCPRCPDLQFRLKKEFIEHRATVHGNICEKCGKRLSTNDRLIDHYKRVHKMTFTYTCPMCNLKFKTRLALRTHRSKVHLASKETRAKMPERPPKTAEEMFWASNPCTECGRTFLNGVTLANHLKVKHEKMLPKEQRKKVVRKCYFCHKSYRLEQSHWVHRRLEHPDNKLEFPCGQCITKENPAVFQTIPELLAHFEGSHNSETVFTCVGCQWPFLDKTCFKVHVNCHVNKKEDPDIKDARKETVCKFNCYFCWELFPNDEELQRHLKFNTRHRKPPLKMEFCCDDFECQRNEKPFSTVADLRHHLESVHTNNEVFTCDRCSWSFLSKEMLELHGMNHVPRRASRFKCPACDHMVTILPSLRDHFNTRHGVSLKIYKCSHCNDRFPSRRGLVMHENQKHDRYSETLAKEGIPCDQCGKMVKNEKSLKCHYATVHRNISCPDCPLVFTSGSKLIYHRKRAHGYGHKYLCNVCGKVFHERTTLVNHMVFHKEQRYECHVCGKKMVTLKTFKEHLKKFHEQKKPTGSPKKFSCDQCGAGYSRKDSLDDHIRKQHTNDTHRVWSCDKCGKRFIRPGYLKEHLKGKKGCTTRITFDEAMREEQQD